MDTLAKNLVVALSVNFHFKGLTVVMLTENDPVPSGALLHGNRDQLFCLGFGILLL